MKMLKHRPKLRRAAEKTRLRSRASLPKRELAPVEDAVEQGMLVANAAIRMSVKNSIIMNALGHGLDYNEEQVHELVKRAIMQLVTERERDVARLRRILYGTNYGDFEEVENALEENEDDDYSTMMHRCKVYKQLAKQLRAKIQDEAYLGAIAEAARELAWKEVADSIQAQARQLRYLQEESKEYHLHREERIQAFIEGEIRQLRLRESRMQREEKKHHLRERARRLRQKAVRLPKGLVQGAGNREGRR